MFTVINQLRIVFSNIFRPLVIIVGSYALMALPVSAAPFAYVTTGNTNIFVIDTITNSVVSSIPIMGGSPEGIAITPDGKRVYVTNYLNNYVSVIDTATNSVVVPSISVGFDPHGIAITPDGKRVYVTNIGSSDVSVIDTATNTVVALISLGNNPAGIAITPDGKKAYVTNVISNNNNVAVIDTATNMVITSITVGLNPIKVAITPDGKRLYVTNSESNNVSVIDTTTETVIKSISVGNFPFGLAIAPDGKRVYVTNENSNNVTVIDTITNTVVASISVGIAPVGVAITPDGKRLYVANSFRGEMSIIDTATNTVEPSPNLGGLSAWYIAITPLPLTNFSAFNVNNLKIDENRRDLIILSNIALGKDSNGINPKKETVTLKIGNTPLTIPPGAFKEKHHGPFTYVGQIDNVWIKALIKPLDHNRFGFQVAAYGADLSGINNPVPVELTVGDDSGITSVNAIFKQNYDTHDMVRGH